MPLPSFEGGQWHNACIVIVGNSFFSTDIRSKRRHVVMRTVRLTLGMVLLFGILLLSACSSGSGSSSGPKQIKTIGLTVQAISNPFFVAVQHGAEAEAKKIGATV